MDKIEPTFVPEWLKNNGSSATTSHQSSSLHSDDQRASKSVRNKSLDNNLGRPTTSSYFRRPASSNGGSHLRSYSSFGRNRDRDKDRDKERFESRHGVYNHSDPLANILPSRFEKDGLRRSHSNLSVKHGGSWPRKIVGEKNGHNNGKISFERDFPSLVVEDKQGDFEIGRVPSPGLSSAIQSLPIGSSGGVIGGDVWTSALAEVPVMVGTNGINISAQQPVQPTSISGTTTSVATGRNMAETLAQGSPRAQTAPQLSIGTQRLEELAVKQSRQLIPMTPMPKTLVLNSSDKPKVKMGQLQFQSSHTPSPRPVAVKSDVSKTSSSYSVGKLHVLKPSRERNCTIAPTAKESTSPTGGSKFPSSPISLTPVVRSAPLRNTERKVCEKRPSPQAKSRNDFFNLMRKKSMANNSSSPDTGSSDLTNDKTNEGGTQASTVVVDTSCGVQPFGENQVDLSCRGDDTCAVTERSSTTSNNGNNLSSCDVILNSEEEEARFLRSLGWEETTEEEGLTEEEINSFYRDVSKYVNLKTASDFFKGTQPKSLMPLNLQMRKNGDITPDTKVDS